MVDPDTNAEHASRHHEFDVEGETWVAEITGLGAVGGALGSVAIESIHFRCKDTPAATVRYTYLPRGILDRLDDDELRRLQRTARPLEPRTTDKSTAATD